MLTSIVFFTLKEAAEEDAENLLKKQDPTKEKSDGTLQERNAANETDTSKGILYEVDDKTAFTKDETKNICYKEDQLEKVFKAVVKQHQSWLPKVLDDAKCWAAARSARSIEVVESIANEMKESNSAFPNTSWAMSCFPEAKILIRFLLEYAPLQLIVDRSKPSKISLDRKLLSVCSLMTVARQVVSEADETYRDPAKRKSDDEYLNLALLPHIQTRRAPVPSPFWKTRHDGVLVRAIVKHGWLNSTSAYSKLKSDVSLRWNVPQALAEAKPEETNSVEDAEALAHLNRTAQEAARLLTTAVSSDALVGFNIDYVSKVLCLQKDNDKWVVNEEKFGRQFHSLISKDVDFTLPSRIDLVKRATAILPGFHSSHEHNDSTDEKAGSRSRPSDSQSSGAETSTEGNRDHGFCVLDQTNPRNVLLAEILKWLLKTKQTNNLRTWKAVARLAEMECRRLATTCSDDKMKQFTEHLVFLTHSVASRGSSRLVKNVLKVILGMDPQPDPKNPQAPLFPPSRNDGPNSRFPGNAAEACSTDTVSDDHLTGKKSVNSLVQTMPSLAEAAIARCSKGSILKCSTDNTSDTEKKPLPLTMLETIILRVASSHGIPVWEEEYSDWTSDTICSCENKLTWCFLADRLNSLAKQWQELCVEELEAAKLALRKAEQSSSCAPSTLKKHQDRHASLTNTVRSRESVIPYCEALASNPRNLAKKTVMLLEAILHVADLKDAKKGSNQGKVANGLGLGIVKWSRSEMNRWAASLEILNRENGLPWNGVVSEYLKNRPELDIVLQLDKKACRAIHSQVFQQTRLRSIVLNHSNDDFSLLICKASMPSQKSVDAWPGRPDWWTPGVDDVTLATGIVKFGYAGFEDMLREENLLRACNDLDKGSVLRMDAAQTRLLQLTRELHQLNEMEERIQLTHAALSGASRSTGRPTGNKQQTLIGSFFVRGQSKGKTLGAATSAANGIPSSDASEPESGQKLMKIEDDVVISVIDTSCSEAEEPRAGQKR